MSAELAQCNPDTPNWQDQGLCRRLPDVTVDDFYFEGRFRGESTALERHIQRLRSICAACPVRSACDEAADAANERDGFWAGLTGEERYRRRKARQRAARARRRALAAQQQVVLVFR
jgi:WhiB family redox-sensing transcriptional regulator